MGGGLEKCGKWRKTEGNGGEMHRIFQISLFVSSPFFHFFGGSDGKLPLPTAALLKLWYPNIWSGKMGGKQNLRRSPKNRVHRSLAIGTTKTTENLGRCINAPPRAPDQQQGEVGPTVRAKLLPLQCLWASLRAQQVPKQFKKGRIGRVYFCNSDSVPWPRAHVCPSSEGYNGGGVRPEPARTPPR